ncbi:phage tail protein [Roseovarius aestuariivivens]|uniref:phage tail protein n=1 Tax=Roseovarius aestuariivivens TaxID=1888910 RepID=UPI001081557D|nr:tail fiber protein [Roseovarius aestuariivivens]
MRRLFLAAAAAAVSTLTTPAPVKAGIDPYLGDIMIVGFNFCPRGWAAADGQLLPISSNQALFSLLGTTYGGDGRTTFALPDLRGRSPIASGMGPGLPNYQLGQRSGSETTAMTQQNLPNHTHNVVGVPTGRLQATSSPPTSNAPGGNLIPTFPAGERVYAGSQTVPVPMNNATVDLDVQISLGTSGNNIRANNMQPYQVLNFCIATQGLFPPRN